MKLEVTAWYGQDHTAGKQVNRSELTSVLQKPQLHGQKEAQRKPWVPSWHCAEGGPRASQDETPLPQANNSSPFYLCTTETAL